MSSLFIVIESFNNYTGILPSDNSKDPEQVDSEGELFLVRKLSIHETVYEFL